MLDHAWQFVVLGGAAVASLPLRRRVVTTIVAAGATGIIAALAGAPVS